MNNNFYLPSRGNQPIDKKKSSNMDILDRNISTNLIKPTNFIDNQRPNNTRINYRNNYERINNKNSVDSEINNFVNNKEIFNDRLFERNYMDFNQYQNKINPTYFNENYNSNRNQAYNIFENRIIDPGVNINNRPNLVSYDFRNTDQMTEFNSKFSNNIEFNKNYDDYI